MLMRMSFPRHAPDPAADAANPAPAGRPSDGRQRGASLLEVLVAVVVLSVGMLSYVNLQAVALATGKMAQFRAVATQLAADYGDRMRANAPAALAGNYGFQMPYAPGPVAVPACAVPGSCSGAEMALIDQAVWRNIADDSLPGAFLFARMDPALPPPPLSPVAAMDLWVIWRDPAMDDADEAGEGCPAIVGAPAGTTCMHFRIVI